MVAAAVISEHNSCCCTSISTDLRKVLVERVDGDSVVAAAGTHDSKVVALGVPGHLADLARVGQDEADAAVDLSSAGGLQPLHLVARQLVFFFVGRGEVD